MALVALLVALVTIGLVTYEPWLPLRHGRLDPPAPDTAGLEKPLARRIAELTGAVAAAPYDADAWGRLAVVYDVHDMPAEAIVCYERAHRLAPDVFRWPYFLGISRLEFDHRGAFEAFGAAQRLHPDYAPLALHLGRGAFDLGRLDAAEGHYRRAASLDPALVRPHIGLAQVALARDDPAGALVHLERGLALGPQTGEVQLLLAECHRRLGDQEAAARHLALAGEGRQFEDFPDPIRSKWQWDAGVTTFWRATRSRRYLREGLAERALAEWTSLLRTDPRSIRALYEIARIHEAVGSLGPALAAYEQALAVDPDRPGLRHARGVVLCKQGRLDEGIAQLREAVAAQPDDARIRGDLARALRHAGRMDEAVEAWISCAAVLERGERLDAAVEALRRAQEIDPDRVDVLTRLARVLEQAGRRDEALEVLADLESASPPG
jgi:tetratricopeptide (TPR) repeat protein